MLLEIFLRADPKSSVILSSKIRQHSTDAFVATVVHVMLFRSLTFGIGFSNVVYSQIIFGHSVHVYRWDLQAQVGLEQMFAI